MATFTSPPEDGDAGDLIVPHPFNMVLSPDEITGAPSDENVLYLLPSGKIVASKLPIEGARLIAYEQTP